VALQKMQDWIGYFVYSSVLSKIWKLVAWHNSERRDEHREIIEVKYAMFLAISGQRDETWTHKHTCKIGLEWPVILFAKLIT
jgi:hypothetical protein